MERTFDLQNITEVTAQNGDKLNGLAITLTGMVIVFLALVLITLYIAILPRLLNALALILPTEHPAVKKPPRETSAVSSRLIFRWGITNGPKAKPIDEPLPRPPSDRPKRAGNQSTSRYSTPAANRGVVVTPKPELKA